MRSVLARVDRTSLWIAGALALGLSIGLASLVVGQALSGARPEPAVAAPLLLGDRPGPTPVAFGPVRPAPLRNAPARRGLLTFRGDASRSFYGIGPVPRHPQILWRYPSSGGMCMRSADETGKKTWCGVGWTGQANVVQGDAEAVACDADHRGRAGFARAPVLTRAGKRAAAKLRCDARAARVEIRFGAFDGAYHFLDGETGTELRPSLQTGDLAKGSATSDPDGYPLYYAGSRDNRLRVVALDRPEPTVLWSLDAHATGRPVVWNDDWDGAPLVFGDYLIEGGENSWLYVIRLNRGYDADGHVRVAPTVAVSVPSWDAKLEQQRPDRAFSIENSVAFRNGVVYFANSAGLVQGWDISRVLAGGRTARRVFRFWTGDDTDASIVVDEQGYLYVASELEKFDGRSARVGQLMKLDPRRPRAPLVWSVPVREIGFGGKGGIWSTPALDRRLLYAATNAGGLLGVERGTGRVIWRVALPGPTWSSPVVVDGVLLEGDCAGVLHAYDVRDQRRPPAELWRVTLGGCIEATPAVWLGRIYVGTRGGAMYAIGPAPH